MSAGDELPVDCMTSIFFGRGTRDNRYKALYTIEFLHHEALFAQIKADGYEGGYTQLTSLIWDRRGREGKALHAFIPLKFELGETFQFDWSEEGLVAGGICWRDRPTRLMFCS